MKKHILKGIFATAIVLVLIACSSPALVQDQVELVKEFRVPGAGSIELNSVARHLDVVTGPPDRIRITAILTGTGANLQDAKESRETLIVSMSQEESKVTIIGDQNIAPGNRANAWVDYIIEIPPNTDLDMQTRRSQGNSATRTDAISLPLVLGLLAVGVVVALTIMVLLTRLRQANLQIQKLVFELRSVKGDAHMRRLQEKWSHT